MNKLLIRYYTEKTNYLFAQHYVPAQGNEVSIETEVFRVVAVTLYPAGQRWKEGKDNHVIDASVLLEKLK